MSKILRGILCTNVAKIIPFKLFYAIFCLSTTSAFQFKFYIFDTMYYVSKEFGGKNFMVFELWRITFPLK